MRALVVGALVLAGGTAHADVRLFTRTYEYSTVPEGRTTIDLWHTQGRTSWDADTAQAFAQVLEVEHGITDSIDLALLTTFEEVTLGRATTALSLRETRVTGRYRFVERAEWPIDTMVHVSAAKDFGASIYRFEGKLVGARDFDRITVAANAILELDLGNDVDGHDLVFSAAAGASSQLHPTLRAGAEGVGTFESDLQPISLGPVVNWFPTSSFWLTVGAGFGVTDEADAFAVRAILGLEL